MICAKERFGEQAVDARHSAVGVKSEQPELSDCGYSVDVARDAASSTECESEILDSHLPQQVTEILSESTNFKNFVLLLEPYVAGILSFERLVCTGWGKKNIPSFDVII